MFYSSISTSYKFWCLFFFYLECVFFVIVCFAKMQCISLALVVGFYRANVEDIHVQAEIFTIFVV